MKPGIIRAFYCLTCNQHRDHTATNQREGVTHYDTQ
nr:MAG TPA: hypothetical protein [Caudoviricetes sp.]